MRVGVGYDVHRLELGRRLVLGGVEIAHAVGLAGHSDADVLLHAIIDALLGAIALGDIGQHFPPGDPRYKDAASLGLLDHVRRLVASHGYEVNNVDATVVAQQPRLAPYTLAMRQRIASTLQVDVERVSVKATTTEGLGFAGRGEGIAAYSVASLVKKVALSGVEE
jgi:2-C-methyl-D-erythritol 2,4-cyclodiphosphate synthase